MFGPQAPGTLKELKLPEMLSAKEARKRLRKSILSQRSSMKLNVSGNAFLNRYTNCPKGLLCRELKNLCSSGVVRPSVCSTVCNAAIKAIWTFSKFSLILLWKGFGDVTHRQLLDPKFDHFTSKFVDFLDQKWIPKMDSFRHARRATLPCGCNLVRLEFLNRMRFSLGDREMNEFIPDKNGA